MDTRAHSSPTLSHAEPTADASTWATALVAGPGDEASEAARLSGLAAWFASYDDPAFWSDFGEEGLAVVFDLPAESLRSLSPAQRGALFALFMELADDPAHPLLPELARLVGEPPSIRLSRLLQLTASSRAGGPRGRAPAASQIR